MICLTSQSHAKPYPRLTQNSSIKMSVLLTLNLLVRLLTSSQLYLCIYFFICLNSLLSWQHPCRHSCLCGLTLHKHYLEPPPRMIQDMFLPLIPLWLLDASCQNSWAVFCVLSGLVTQRDLGLNGVPPFVLRNCALTPIPCLVKLFHPCLSTPSSPSCWRCTNTQPVLKMGDINLALQTTVLQHYFLVPLNP